MAKITCPCCFHEFDKPKATKKVASLSVEQPTMADGQGRTLWGRLVKYSDGVERMTWATFPHDQKRYEAIVRKHKAAAFMQMRRAYRRGGKEGNFAAHYIDSGFR